MTSEHHRDSGAAYDRRGENRPPVFDRKARERDRTSAPERTDEEKSEDG